MRRKRMAGPWAASNIWSSAGPRANFPSHTGMLASLKPQWAEEMQHRGGHAAPHVLCTVTLWTPGIHPSRTRARVRQGPRGWAQWLSSVFLSSGSFMNPGSSLQTCSLLSHGNHRKPGVLTLRFFYLGQPNSSKVSNSQKQKQKLNKKTYTHSKKEPKKQKNTQFVSETKAF